MSSIVTVEAIKGLVGRRATLRLAPEAGSSPSVTGRVVGVLDALDGLIVTLEPDGAAPGARLTYHYHHIADIAPAEPGA